MYDLQTDPKELNNVYDNPDYAEVQAHMHDKLKEIRIQYQDASDSLNQEWIDKDIERLKSQGWY